MDQLFHKFVRRVKVKFPTGWPVHLRCRPMKKAAGTVNHHYPEDGDPGHNICIASNAELDTALDAFIHEYAHCLDIEFNPTRVVEHNAFWSIKYGELYRDMERFLIAEGHFK